MWQSNLETAGGGGGIQRTNRSWLLRSITMPTSRGKPSIRLRLHYSLPKKNMAIATQGEAIAWCSLHSRATQKPFQKARGVVVDHNGRGHPYQYSLIDNGAGSPN